MSEYDLPITIKELKKRVNSLQGSEFKMDFTYDKSGSVVSCYIAQSDFNKGITVRGARPYLNPRGEGEDVDLRCVNKGKIGKAHDTHDKYTYKHYLYDLYKTVKAVEDGAYIVPPIPNYSSGISCAF